MTKDKKGSLGGGGGGGWWGVGGGGGGKLIESIPKKVDTSGGKENNHKGSRCRRRPLQEPNSFLKLTECASEGNEQNIHYIERREGLSKVPRNLERRKEREGS